MSASKLDVKRDAHCKKKVEQERLQIILNELLREEDNKYCADCEAKGPRWASWNIGVFLCIRCAGIHRNLGVHVSKVKSVNLDVWTLEQVQSVRIFGNSVAKAVYEAHLPEHFRRPQTDGTLETFIRAKYELKRYVMKDWQPPKIDVRQLIQDLENFSSRSHAHGTKKVASSPSMVDHKTRQSSSVPRHSDQSAPSIKNCEGAVKNSTENRHVLFCHANSWLQYKLSNQPPPPFPPPLQLGPRTPDLLPPASFGTFLAQSFFRTPPPLKIRCRNSSNSNDPSKIAAKSNDIDLLGLDVSSEPPLANQKTGQAGLHSDFFSIGDQSAITVDKSPPVLISDSSGAAEFGDFATAMPAPSSENAELLLDSLSGKKNDTDASPMFNTSALQTNAPPLFSSQNMQQTQNFAVSTNQNRSAPMQQMGGASLFNSNQSQTPDFAAFNPFNQSNTISNSFPYNQTPASAYATPTGLATSLNFGSSTTILTPPTYVQPSNKNLDLKAVQDQLAAIKLQKGQQKPVGNALNSDLWQ